MKCFLLLFLFLNNIASGAEVSIEEVCKSELRTNIFELDNSKNSKHIILVDSEAKIDLVGFASKVVDLRYTKQLLNRCKIDWFIGDNRLYRVVSQGVEAHNLFDRDIEDIQIDNPYVARNEQKKGLVFYFTDPKQDFDFNSFTQRIEKYQEKGWKVCIYSHSREFSQRIRDWHSHRGADATMSYTSTRQQPSHFYRTAVILMGVCALLWGYHFFMSHKHCFVS